MTPAKELPKVIEKSQEEIEQIITLVQTSDLPEDIKPFVVGCINLASWIPRALVEHKITVSNLKRLIIGKGDKATQKQTNTHGKNNTAPEEQEPSASNDETHAPEVLKGHGRLVLPNTIYIRAPKIWPMEPIKLWWQALSHRPRYHH